MGVKVFCSYLFENLYVMATSPLFRTLVVPFDFSPVAIAAAHQAAYLAGRMSCSLSLWLIHDRYSETQLGVPDGQRSVEVFRRFATLRLEDLGASFLRTYGVRIGYEWLEGKVQKSVELKAQAPDVSMLVLGTFGDKKQDAIFQDSQANKLAIRTALPVLAIRSTEDTPGFRRIFMGLEIENFNSREKIPYAVRMAEANHAEVHILGMERHRDQESVSHLKAIMAQAERYFMQRDIPVRSEIRPIKSKGSGSVQMATELKADLMVVMAEAEGPFGGFLGDVFPQYVTHHFAHPVLIVPPKVSTVTAQVTI